MTCKIKDSLHTNETDKTIGIIVQTPVQRIDEIRFDNTLQDLVQSTDMLYRLVNLYGGDLVTHASLLLWTSFDKISRKKHFLW